MILLSSGQKDFIREGLQFNCRPDGRGKLERRPQEISFGENTLCNSNSACKLRLPDTKSYLLISAKAELTKPTENEPNSGILIQKIVSSKLSELNLNQSKYLQAKLADMTKFQEHGLLKYVPKESLGLVEGSLCWLVYIDAYVLGELDYNHLDHLSLGIRQTLKTLTLPELDIKLNQLNNQFTIDVLPKTHKPLLSANFPMLLCVGQSSDKVFFDLSYEEFQSVEASFVVSYDMPTESIHLVQKLGNLFVFLKKTGIWLAWNLWQKLLSS